MDAVKKIELLGTADGKPSRLVKIVDCGETSEQKIQDAAGTEKGTAQFLISKCNILMILLTGIFDLHNASSSRAKEKIS